MSEDITVRVSLESNGAALNETMARIEQLKARITELNRLEQTYAAQGIMGTTNLSRERMAATRELRSLERDEAKAAKERRDEDKEAAREQKALRAARLRAAGDFAGAAGLPGAGAISGGIAGVLATAAGAIIGKVIGDELAVADTKNAERGELIGTFNRSRRNRGRTNAVEAQAEASGELQRNVAELAEAEDRKGKFAPSGLMDRLMLGANNILGTSFETSDVTSERKNQEKIDRLKQEQPRLLKDAEAAYLKGPGGAELEMKKALLNYDMKSVRALQDKIAGQKEYDRVIKAVGGEDATEEGKAMARDAADTAVSLQQRERAGKLAGLVNARDGMRDVTRIASIAGGMTGDKQAWSALHDIHTTMKQQHAENRPVTDWTKPR